MPNQPSTILERPARQTVPTTSRCRTGTGGCDMSSTVLLIVLIIVLLAVLPTWPYSSGWGYYPSGILGLIVVVLLILALTGRL
jgi:hypothetical protein